MPTKPLNIISISAEVAPYSKAGGLGDVGRSLPKALSRLGHNVTVITPLHGVIDIAEHGLKKIGNDVDIAMDETASLQFDYWRSHLLPKLPVYFIDRKEYFSGLKTIYQSDKPAERFFFFCLAALRLVEILELKPDIIHCHDWHAGLVPYFARKRFKSSAGIERAAMLFTIHNLFYQGQEPDNDDGHSRLPRFAQKEAIKKINFAKRGIIYADLINTVSEQYAQEIMTPKFGEDLHRILKNRKARLYGVVNGIDYNDFNPENDPAIKQSYAAGSLEGKIANKLDLQKSFNLPIRKDAPVLGIVSRITEQKGFDLLMEIADRLLEKDLQLVIAGKGQEKYERFFVALQKKNPEKVGALLQFDTKAAARIYAGSDLFLMPSRFEPCGLGQLISLRYGSVPVVHSVGGLADTVTDYNPKTGKGNGFVFAKYDAVEFLTAIVRALETFRHEAAWKKLVVAGMRQSHSWEIPARKYLTLYRKAVRLRRAEKN